MAFVLFSLKTADSSLMISHQIRLLVAAISVCVAGHVTNAAPIVMQFSGISTAGEVKFQSKSLPTGTKFSIVGVGDTANRIVNENSYGMLLDDAYLSISGKGTFRFEDAMHISSSLYNGAGMFSFGVIYKPHVSGRMPSGGSPAWDMTTSLAPTSLIAKDTFLMQTWTTGGSFAMYGLGFPEYALTFSASVGPLADLDGDQSVDDDDLALWKVGFGLSGTLSPLDGDANRDGTVDGADFLQWQRDHASVSPAATIPEPKTLVLVIAATTIMASRGRPT